MPGKRYAARSFRASSCPRIVRRAFGRGVRGKAGRSRRRRRGRRSPRRGRRGGGRRARGRRAGDVPRERLDVRDELRAALSGGGAAHAPAEGDAETAVRSLIRPDDERLRLGGAVEARPVEVREAVVEFTSHRRHRSDPVALAFDQRVDTGERLFIPCGTVGRGGGLYIHGADGSGGGKAQSVTVTPRQKAMRSLICAAAGLGSG